MSDTTVIPESAVRGLQPIEEIDVLWITAGLGCDGDTIAITAATQPSIEDIVLGAMRTGRKRAGRGAHRICWQGG